MSESFDPYRRWLGIRDAARPPNHYRLLGVELFEPDPAVLESSADRQMGHVRTFQSGQHSTLSQRLLNEIAQAKLCLLNPRAKAAYDAQLRVQLGMTAPAQAAPLVRYPAELKSPAAFGPKPPGAFADPNALDRPATVAGAAVGGPAPDEGAPSFANVGEPLPTGIDGREEYQRLSTTSTLWRALLIGWTMMLVAIMVVWTWFWPEIEPSTEVKVERRIVIREKPKTEKPVKATVAPSGPPELEELRPLGEHKNGLWALAVSPDGRRAATAGTDRTVRIWDVGKAEELLETVTDDLTTGVAWTPSNEAVALAGVDGIVRLWDVTGDEHPVEVCRHASDALCAAVSPDGTLLASGGKDGVLLVHRLPEFPRIHRKEAHSGSLAGLAFTSDSRRLATVGADGLVRLWNMDSGEMERSFEGHSAPTTAVAISRDGTTLLSGAKDGGLRVWDMKSGQLRFELTGHADMVRAALILPDGRAATAGADRTIRLWDLTSGVELARGTKHSAAVFGLALLPGDRLASVGADASARTWKLPPVAKP